MIFGARSVTSITTTRLRAVWVTQSSSAALVDRDPVGTARHVRAVEQQRRAASPGPRRRAPRRRRCRRRRSAAPSLGPATTWLGPAPPVSGADRSQRRSIDEGHFAGGDGDRRRPRRSRRRSRRAARAPPARPRSLPGDDADRVAALVADEDPRPPGWGGVVREIADRDRYDRPAATGSFDLEQLVAVLDRREHGPPGAASDRCRAGSPVGTPLRRTVPCRGRSARSGSVREARPRQTRSGDRSRRPRPRAPSSKQLAGRTRRQGRRDGRLGGGRVGVSRAAARRRASEQRDSDRDNDGAVTDSASARLSPRPSAECRGHPRPRVHRGDRAGVLDRYRCRGAARARGRAALARRAVPAAGRLYRRRSSGRR